MPIPPTAPYDTLETVTSQVRTIIGDYIAGLAPVQSGRVNANGTVTLAWVSGNKFNFSFVGAQIQVNGVPNTVLAVNSPISLTLTNAAAVGSNVTYSATIPTGDLFQDSQGYVLPIINLAWRKLQKKLANKGHPRLRREIFISGIPVVTSQDPRTQQWISWTNFFDGTNLLSPSTIPAGPVLPPDWISPLKMFERQSNTVSSFGPRQPVPDALWSRQKGSYNYGYDWHDDALFVPGSMLLMDWRFDYAAFLPDIVPAATFDTTPIPIMRCAEALAYYSADTYVTPRGGILGPSWEQKGDMATAELTNSAMKLQQRSRFSRPSWGDRGRRGYSVYR